MLYYKSVHESLHIYVTYYCHILLYNINMFMLITFALIAFEYINRIYVNHIN